jgi:hypothetical protein
MQLLQQAGAWQELEQLAPTFEHMQVRLLVVRATRRALPPVRGCV